VQPPRLDEAAEVTAPAVTAPSSGGVRARLSALRDSETAAAVSLGAAAMVANVVAVGFTVVFTRLLGVAGYGSLAALLNLTVILFVPGYALQVATARAGTLGRLGAGRELAATLRRWTAHLLLGLAAVAALAALAREPLAALLNVDEEWAAAGVPATAGLWLLLCVQRGLLQAHRAYRAVALSVALEALGRLAAALVLVAAGGGVTGAYLGTGASIALTAVALGLLLRRRLGPADPRAPQHPLRRLARAAGLPIAALTLVAALQNLDVIVAKHVLGADVAGVYAATAVAAKATVWIAIGLGLWVLPEATRRLADGLDPRSVLVRALALIGAVAAVELVIYAIAPRLVLRIAFGADYEDGAGVLLALGVAYALLACATLTVQYLLALHERAFVYALGVAALVLGALLAGAGSGGLESFAAVVLGVQAAAAAALLALALRHRPAAPA
jgi:O-antigen/teichoic acid export membrane protein